MWFLKSNSYASTVLLSRVGFFFKLSPFTVCPKMGTVIQYHRYKTFRGSVGTLSDFSKHLHCALRNQSTFETSSPLPHCPPSPHARSKMKDTKWAVAGGEERELWVGARRG